MPSANRGPCATVPKKRPSNKTAVPKEYDDDLPDAPSVAFRVDPTITRLAEHPSACTTCKAPVAPSAPAEAEAAAVLRLQEAFRLEKEALDRLRIHQEQQARLELLIKEQQQQQQEGEVSAAIHRRAIEVQEKRVRRAREKQLLEQQQQQQQQERKEEVPPAVSPSLRTYEKRRLIQLKQQQQQQQREDDVEEDEQLPLGAYILSQAVSEVHAHPSSSSHVSALLHAGAEVRAVRSTSRWLCLSQGGWVDSLSPSGSRVWHHIPSQFVSSAETAVPTASPTLAPSPTAPGTRKKPNVFSAFTREWERLQHQHHQQQR